MSSDQTDTRSKILKACLALLAEGAGSGIRMSDIAKRAGVSRQALYLHFESRGDLVIAATQFQDQEADIQRQLETSRKAPSGRARLSAFIQVWCRHIPVIYPVARTIMHLAESDEEVANVWRTRMEDMREGCEAAVSALERDGELSASYDKETATDLLWCLVSVRNWELLTKERGWSQSKFEQESERTARRLFVSSPNGS